MAAPSSWTSLVLGHARSGRPAIALALYARIKDEDLSPPPCSRLFVALLNCCASVKAASIGRDLHRDLAQLGLDSDIYVGNALIDMYVKCGFPSDAHLLLDSLPIRDVVSWTALIAGLSALGHGERALRCFEHLQIEGAAPNDVTYLCCLKACGCVGKASSCSRHGRAMHRDIACKGVSERNPAVANAVVDMYAKCGFLVDALAVFASLPARNVVSWNTLMSAYVRCGCNDEVLNCSEQMQEEGVPRNATTFVCCLVACGSVGKCREIHCQISESGTMEKELAAGNAVVDAYVKFGSLLEARSVFDKLRRRDVVSWTTLIAGYVKHGHGREALECFAEMKAEGVSPNAITFICAMNACGNIGAKETAESLYAEIIRSRLLDTDVDVGSTVVDMYAKCGLLEKARAVFDTLLLRDEVSWNALIAAYANEGHAEEALYCFEQMGNENISPDAITFVSILKACGDQRDTKKIREIHAEILRRGFLERDVAVGNALINAYCKCGMLTKSQEVFDKLRVQDAVSWNALISGYTQHGYAEEALNRFQLMRVQDVSPDTVTFACTLKACAGMRAHQKGYEIQSEITKRGLHDNDVALSNALVDMYAGFGWLTEAEEIFDKLKVQDVLSWTIMISGYSNNGYGEKAIQCYKKMREGSICADGVSFSCVLKACGSIGASEQGQVIYEEILGTDLLEKDVVIGNAVVDMFANLGAVDHAQRVFDELLVHDVVSWNSLIAGYAQVGQCENVFRTFRKMVRQRQMPNMVTFLGLLAACSHGGLLGESHLCFGAMMDVFNLIPTVKHYICMLDILCRTGQIENALAIVEEMPFHPNAVSWNTVLGGCQRWGEKEPGIEAFEHAIHLVDNDAAVYVSLSNMYANIDATVK